MKRFQVEDELNEKQKEKLIFRKAIDDTGNNQKDTVLLLQKEGRSDKSQIQVGC